MTQPLFPGEGPQYYGAAYAHNRPFATGGPYQTTLPADKEQQFRQWVVTNRVPFNPDENPTDYDMRGFWRETGAAGWHPGSHFPDLYKTPYDTTFSNQSKYATANCPFAWHGDNLIDERDNTLIYGSWRGEIKRAAGGIVTFPIAMSQGGPTPTTAVQLNPGDRLTVFGPGGAVVQQHWR
jgi:hypothetical protein